MNAIWNKTETKNDTLNRQLLGIAPITQDKKQVFQFIIFETGKKTRAALDATDLKKWSQKKIDKYDSDNDTDHGSILSEITDKPFANTIESFYKSIKKAMQATDDTTETAETTDEATETDDEATETLPEPETVEDFGIAIAALYLAGIARGFNKGEMAQIAADVMKTKA